MAPMGPTEADRPAGRQLDEIAAELYAMRPDEFVAARDDRVRAIRAAGDANLAREVGRLRRPTQSAWLVNALWRDRQDEIEELLELADEFRRALSQGKREALQELTARRRSLETALLKRARALADGAGLAAAGDTLREVQETLASALSEHDVAAEVRTGRLVRPVTASGFGTGTPDLRVLQGGKSTPVRTSGRAGRRTSAGQPSAGRSSAGTRGEQTTSDRRIAEAEQRVHDAEETVAETAEALAERKQAAEEAAGRHAEIRELLARMEEQLRDLEKQLSAARSAAADETRRRDLADRAHRKAQDALEKAKQRLAALTPASTDIDT
jgi:hypothetical protein